MIKVYIENILALGMLFLMIPCVPSQEFVNGTVYNTENEPLAGVIITAPGSKEKTKSDINGKYRITLPEEASTLKFYAQGYWLKTIIVDTLYSIDVYLKKEELIEVGYGNQGKTELSSSIEQFSPESFNRGYISDPFKLIQGKVAGLQIYNRGGDPNSESIVRIRGISSVGGQLAPLVVIDGMIGTSIGNLDPLDIETITILKDGSAAAIYGSRASNGVILVTTKRGKASSDNKGLYYTGQLGVAMPSGGIDVMDRDQYLTAGGWDLGNNTEWVDRVTRSGMVYGHHLVASGESGNTRYRISGTLRDVEGVVLGSGMDQYNTRLNLDTKTLNDKLNIRFTTSYTDRESNFGFDEVLRYAITANPTAPVYGNDAPFLFNAEQYGGYFELLGLFDYFNPVSIAEQNSNTGKRKEFNFGVNLDYQLTDALKFSARVSQQSIANNNRHYYPTTSLFRGNASSIRRKGRADFYDDNISSRLLETFGSYSTAFGSTSLTITGGYSFYEDNFESHYLQLGDFPDNSLNFSNLIEVSQDLQNAGFIRANSDAVHDDKVIAFFGRATASFNHFLYLNASLRREGSTRLGSDNKWGMFSGLGMAMDFSKYLKSSRVNLLKFRMGYGITGSLPRESGLSQPVRWLRNLSDGGAVSELVRAPNPDLSWEEKKEFNIGMDLASGRLNGSIEYYTRSINGIITERSVESIIYGVDRMFANVGKIGTSGMEITLDYKLLSNPNFTYNTGLVFSTSSTILKEGFRDSFNGELRGRTGPGCGCPGVIFLSLGNEIGQIWGPVFSGVDAEGYPTFEDLNRDGKLITSADKALEPDVDFEVLGNGLPDFELGWNNEIEINGWHINTFFRGAFGHSLVSIYRLNYEPQLSSQTFYNFVNTRLKVDGLTTARFSSLYVEKADFLKLDYLTISREISIGKPFGIDNLHISLTGQNLFTITNYTGIDPEPSLVDYGRSDNGSMVNVDDIDILAPGIDRKNGYMPSRTIILEVSFNF